MALEAGAGPTMDQNSTVKLTAHFERNLGNVEQFLNQAMELLFVNTLMHWQLLPHPKTFFSCPC